MLGSSFSNDGAVEVFPGLVHLRTGGKVFAVHHSGAAALDGLPSGLASNVDGFFTSVPLALAACRSGYSDRIVCLRRHAENIATADAWSNLGTKTGVEVLSLASGTEAATFTWTTATSTLLMDQEGFKIRGCNLLMAGADAAGSALSVAAPITISAAGCSLEDNWGRFGFDADQLATIGITTTAAADRLTLRRNTFTGATAAEVTTFMDIIGCDHLVMEDNIFSGATSNTGVGIVRFATTASLHVDLRRNFYANRKAASAAAVTGLAGVTGFSRDECFLYLDNSSTTPWVTSPGSMAFFEPRLVNLEGEVGRIPTVVSV